MIAQPAERFLTDERKGKTSNEAFYGWLRREARGLYSRCFQLAFDTARKAERAALTGEPHPLAA